MEKNNDALTSYVQEHPNDRTMNRSERLSALVQLGERLLKKNEYLEAVMHRAQFHNPWFTIDHQQQAIHNIATYFLEAKALESWITNYDLSAVNAPKKVGLIMAGNIPLVGFHDWLSVFITGHRALVKLSDKDPFLFPYLMKLLQEIDSRTTDYTQIVDKLSGFDAVIATGSNNSARYFEEYFSKYPNIIRKNRNGVAVLNGAETEEELRSLGHDVFDYFGLGCRNVSKLYVPEGYDFEPLLEALHEYRQIVLNTKYKNNFDYNYSLYILNKEPFKANGCILLREEKAIPSRIASLHYEYYKSAEEVQHTLDEKRAEIQCVIAQPGSLPGYDTFAFGKAQQPSLTDYADGADTLDFLIGL
jgi:acyl-CoA reductase-like NAD-dependent aldehyde dehydrogenase